MIFDAEEVHLLHDKMKVGPYEPTGAVRDIPYDTREAYMQALRDCVAVWSVHTGCGGMTRPDRDVGEYCLKCERYVEVVNCHPVGEFDEPAH